MTLQYTPDHEWLQSDTTPVGVGDIVTIGITHHAQDALGDVVFVDLPEVGKTLAAREVAGVVESVKAAADVFMPVSGEVTEVNEALRHESARLTRQPRRNRLRRLCCRRLNPKCQGGRHVDAIRQTPG